MGRRSGVLRKDRTRRVHHCAMELRSDGPVRETRDAYGVRSLPIRTALLLMEPPVGDSASAAPSAPRIAKWRFQPTSPRCAHDSRVVLMSFLRQHAAVDADLFTAELILGE